MLAASLAAISLAGCGNKTEQTDNTDSTAADTSATSDKLVMATNAAFPPYEYKEGEEFKGIDVEIAQAIAEKLGTEVEIADMEFDSIIPSVKKGEADFGMAGMTVTEERLQSINFSDSYTTATQVIIVKE